MTPEQAVEFLLVATEGSEAAFDHHNAQNYMRWQKPVSKKGGSSDRKSCQRQNNQTECNGGTTFLPEYDRCRSSGYGLARRSIFQQLIPGTIPCLANSHESSCHWPLTSTALCKHLDWFAMPSSYAHRRKHSSNRNEDTQP